MLLPVARSSVLVAAAELTAFKQSSPKNATNTELLKRALTGCKATAPAHAPYLRPVDNTDHPAGPNIVGADGMSIELKI